MSYVARSENIVMDNDLKFDKFISSLENGLIGVYSTEKDQSLVSLLVPDEIRGGFNAQVFKRYPGKLNVLVGH